MGFNASDNGAARQIAPAGTHVATCFGMLDLGTQTDFVQGKSVTAHKVWIWWELSNEKDQEGKPIQIGAFFTLSLNERANLRKMLDSWRGRPFTSEELKGFDVSKIVGAACMLSVIHEQKQNGIRDKIASVAAMPRGMTAPPLINPKTILNLDSFSQQVYDTLPKFLKDMIAKSPEGQKWGLRPTQQQPQQPQQGYQQPPQGYQQPQPGGYVQFPATQNQPPQGYQPQQGYQQNQPSFLPPQQQPPQRQYGPAPAAAASDDVPF